MDRRDSRPHRPREAVRRPREAGGVLRIGIERRIRSEFGAGGEIIAGTHFDGDYLEKKASIF